jgi:hypothetical protein
VKTKLGALGLVLAGLAVVSCLLGFALGMGLRLAGNTVPPVITPSPTAYPSGWAH